VIVVIGCPIGRLGDGAILAAGMASRVALAAAAAGRVVQLVGKTGDDPIADGVVLDLAQGGVGHVALLRDPARATRLEPPSPADDVEADDEIAADHGHPPGHPADPVPTTDRAAGPALEAADVDLGLRYLTDFAVVVLAEPTDAETIAIVSEAARYGEATMVLVVGAGAAVPDDLPADAVVFEAPDADREGAFATLVGRFAAALDDGTTPAEAFRASVTADGWTEALEDETLEAEAEAGAETG
jgi:hypothetical protein